jgi:hypothetical protein
MKRHLMKIVNIEIINHKRECKCSNREINKQNNAIHNISTYCQS